MGFVRRLRIFDGLSWISFSRLYVKKINFNKNRQIYNKFLSFHWTKKIKANKFLNFFKNPLKWVKILIFCFKKMTNSYQKYLIQKVKYTITTNKPLKKFRILHLSFFAKFWARKGFPFSSAVEVFYTNYRIPEIQVVYLLNLPLNPQHFFFNKTPLISIYLINSRWDRPLITITELRPFK